MSKSILERIRRNATRKSELDADRELLTEAANEIERLHKLLAYTEPALMNWPRPGQD